ncbi:FtsQ-type POTRA domain-containing protein [Mycoplasmatota bacterium zrk1]
MKIEKKIGVIVVSFFLIFIFVTLFIVLTSEYKFNNISINGAQILEEKLIDDIDLENNYFLFSPKFSVNHKLSKLGYISDYTVDREFPNKLEINVEIENVLLCSNDSIVFDDYQIGRDAGLDSLCLDKPVVKNLIEMENKLFLILDSYGDIVEPVKGIIKELNFVDNETLSFNMSDGITVYLTINEDKTISDYLNNYFNYKVEDNIIDLRLKYQ